MQKRYAPLVDRWESLARYQHDGTAWVEALAGDQDEAVVLTSVFTPETYLGEGTILQRDITAMPLDPMTESMAESMWDLTPFAAAGGWGGKTSLNTSSFGTQPIHMYVVDSSHPACGFRQFGGTTTIADGNVHPGEVDLFMRGNVPLPSWAVPAQNGDRGLAVYDLGTGIMREYFMVTSTAGDPDVWQGLGGYSTARAGFRHLATDNYALQQYRGISNVAGMHNSLGFIGIAEALAKKINHALCFTASTLGHSGFPSWPARGADGKAERYAPGGQNYDPENPHMLHDGVPPTPTHGQWGRLKSDVDPMHNPRTNLPYHPLTRVLIEAAKTYGLVATDTNLWCHAFNVEQGRTFSHLYGPDPWATGGLIDMAYRDPVTGTGGLGVEDFPWDRTEWAPVDWGRPSPDWNLRPGQLMPWWSPTDPSRPV